MVLVVIVAFIVGGLALVAIELVLSLGGLQDPDPLHWSADPSDGWALLAEAVPTAFACCLLAWVARGYVRIWTDDWDLRLGPMALAFALTLNPLAHEASAGAGGFVLAVIVARKVALSPRPAPHRQPSRRVRVAAILGVLGLALFALGFRALHPLSAAFESRPSDARFGIAGDAQNPNGARSLDFMLGNDGISTLTVRSIHAVGVEPAVMAVRLRRDDSWSSVARAEPVALGHDETATGALRPSHATCRDAGRDASWSVRALDVRYEALGMTRTQRLAIDPPALLRCRVTR